MYNLPTRIALDCYAGFKRTGLLELAIVKPLFKRAYFLYKRFFEDPFFALSRKRSDLFTSGHVLDVGGNIGYTAVVFASAVKTPFEVHAFEPEPENFRQLKEVTSALAVVPVHAAVGSREGSVELALNERHHADHRILTGVFKQGLRSEVKTCRVPLISLDAYCRSHQILDKVAFVKIDVQGYELEVLRGMEELTRLNPGLSVAFEYCEDDTKALGFEPQQVLSFFLERGFQLYRIFRDGGLAPFSLDQLDDDLQKRSYVDVLACRCPLS